MLIEVWSAVVKINLNKKLISFFTPYKKSYTIQPATLELPPSFTACCTALNPANSCLRSSSYKPSC